MLRDGPCNLGPVQFGLIAVSLSGGILVIMVNLPAERRERAQVQRTCEILFTCARAAAP